MALNYSAHTQKKKNLKLSKSLKTLTSSPPPHELIGRIQTPCTTSESHLRKKISKGLIQACEVNGVIPIAVSGKIPSLELSLHGGYNAQQKQGRSSLEEELLHFSQFVCTQARLPKSVRNSQAESTAHSSLCTSALFTNRGQYHKFTVVTSEIIFLWRIYQQPTFCLDYSR